MKNTGPFWTLPVTKEDYKIYCDLWISKNEWEIVTVLPNGITVKTVKLPAANRLGEYQTNCTDANGVWKLERPYSSCELGMSKDEDDAYKTHWQTVELSI